jgi:hypothetical protein
MFHILIENSTPNHLVGGPWTSVFPRIHSGEVVASFLECGLRGGQVREALSHTEAKRLIKAGKLNRDRACKSCLRRIGGRYNDGKVQKDGEASQSNGETNE